MTSEQLAMVDANEETYLLWKMDPVYSQTFHSFLSSLETVLGPATGGNEKTQRAYAMAANALFLFLCDLCMAHPSESLMEKYGTRRSDWEPGIRFLTFLQRFLSLDAADTSRVLQALLS